MYRIDSQDYDLRQGHYRKDQCAQQSFPEFQPALPQTPYEEYKKKCPIIVGDDVIYVTYLDKSFDVTNQISARDYDGNAATQKSVTFTVDTIPPT